MASNNTSRSITPTTATAPPDPSPLIIKVTLITIVILLAVIGNGGIGILLRRFKSLRTVPNILVGNLAVIDFFNAAVNLPVFLAAGVLVLKHTSGRLTASTIFASQTLVIMLHLLSMLLMMMDRFVAITWGLHYRAWKSKRKVLVAVATVWIIVLSITIPWVFMLYAVDKGNSGYLVYHIAYFHAVGKYNCFVTYPILGITIGAVSALTYLSIKRQGEFYVEKRLAGNNKQGSHLNDARQKNEVKAAKTVAITVILYSFCLIPCLMYCSLMASQKKLPGNVSEDWFVFFVVLSFYIPSAWCPYVYVIRTVRFRRAIVKFMEDPCGGDDLVGPESSTRTKDTSGSRKLEFSWKKKVLITPSNTSSSFRDQESTTVKMESGDMSLTHSSTPECYVGNANKAFDTNATTNKPLAATTPNSIPVNEDDEFEYKRKMIEDKKEEEGEDTNDILVVIDDDESDQNAVGNGYQDNNKKGGEVDNNDDCHCDDKNMGKG